MAANMLTLLIFPILICMVQANSKSLFKTPSVHDFKNSTSDQSAKEVYAKIRDYPFMAKLHIRTGDVELQCGGTLITTKWILTAAHCITPPPGSSKIKRIDVCMGKAYMPNINACDTKRRVKIITRPMTSVDLALLRLTDPFPTTKNIRPLRVVPYNLDNLSKHCKVMGWGWMQPGFSSPHLLQTDVLRLNYCFGNLICVMAKTHAPCRGDSGGPLICNGILVGVASVGENADCTQNSGITAYVPVWQHNNFITHTIANSGYSHLPSLTTVATIMWILIFCHLHYVHV